MLSLSPSSTGRALIAVAVALAWLPAAACAGPADVASGQDLRSPDTRDAASRTSVGTRSHARPTEEQAYPGLADLARSNDLPSPDARDTRVDLRSPDTRDAAAGREYPPTPTVVTLKEIKPEQVPDIGFDWGAAATGAAAAVSVILITAAAVATIMTRRRAHRNQLVAAA
jgi:hypothetical protein